jgi:hypothetical protein
LGGFADDDELEASLSASAALIADFLPAAAGHPPRRSPRQFHRQDDQ